MLYRMVGGGAKKNIHFLKGVWYNEVSVSFGQVFAGKDIGKLWKRK